MSQLEGGKWLMASGGSRPVMLLSTPQCPGWSPTKKTWLQTSVALRNPTSQEIDYIIYKPLEEKDKKKKEAPLNEKSAEEKTSAKKRCCKQHLRCATDI